MGDNSGDLSLGYMMGQSENRGGGGMFGNGADGWLGIVVLALLFGWGGAGGYGGNAALNGIATRADINEGFALNTITSGIGDIRQGIDAVNYNMSNGFCAVQNSINNSTRDIIEASNCNTRSILEFLTQDKINTLTAENQALKFAASQTAQNQFITQVGSDIVNRLQPPPVPAYVVANPYIGYAHNYGTYGNYGYNGCGCGCGC